MSTATAALRHVYVLKLIPSRPGDASLRGRLEHLASGRRHDFDSPQALIGCLHHEEQEVAREAADPNAEAGMSAGGVDKARPASID